MKQGWNVRSCLYKLLAAAGLVVVLSMPGSGEPNVEIAKKWWTEMPNKWTAVGWKDHIMRFNVLHNGTIINIAGWMDRMRKPCPDPNCMFYFKPTNTMEGLQQLAVPHPANPYTDDGSVVQGWKDCETPVLWSEWQYCGQLLRQEVFAHIPGGQEVKRGDEHLFAWVRLSVHYSADGVPTLPATGFGIQITNLTLDVDMKKAWTLRYHHDARQYKRQLKAETEAYDAAKGFHVLEPDGRVRIGVAPNQDCQVSFRSGFPTDKDQSLHVGFSGKTGTHVDILIPMMPVDRETFDKELALGYDGAFREAERYWKKRPATAATFDVPEDYVNQLIRRNLQSSEVMAERDPETGVYTMLTGAMGYGIGTWATPTSITMGMMYDILGYHDVVEKYLATVKDAQGKLKPPGTHFELHPGYLCLPERVCVVPWLSDHGSLLWLISQHALLTGDKEFIEEWTPNIIKACEWIQYARRLEHPGVKGIMPPAGYSDDESRVQAVMSDSWVYKGFTTAVKLLKSIKHPRADEFDKEAREYKAAFIKAYREKLPKMGTWTGPDGKVRHLAPMFIGQESDWQLRHVFYLDGGPLMAVWGGLLDADDPSMKDCLLWFREGPPAKMGRLELDYLSMPFLYHEVSSWEICYSWNIFHTWQLADREKFLEGLYAMLTGGYSQQTYSSCEERGGMMATTHWMPTILHARNSVIDDQIADGELHLLRLCPLAWLRTDREAKFENMPTIYGPVTLKAKLGADGRTLQVTFKEKFRSQPKKVVLHIPPVKGLRSVMLNSKSFQLNSNSTKIEVK